MMTKLFVHTATGFVVIALALIGFGLGLIVTPATTLIMMSVSKAKAGMISSLTSLERTAPMPIGIAIFNLILIIGITGIANRYAVTYSSPADIKMEVLSAGFDIAFLLSFVLGIVILAISLALKDEIHPDYTEDAQTLHKKAE